MPLKVALVGSGKIADGHVEEIQKLGDLARVVAVCDVEPLMSEQLARRYGLPAHYGDFDQMLERERPDVVHVTTPPGAHLELATRALQAGCHVYVEKPLTPTAADSRELIRRAEDAGKKLTCGYTYLFDPPALAMRSLVNEGILGEVVHVDSVYGYDLSGKFGQALLANPSHWVHQLPGKLFHNNIDHMLNKLVEFIDDDEPEVTARALVRRPARFGDARDAMEDELRVLICGQRTTGSCLFSCGARPVGHYCRVFGSKNTAHVDYVMRTVTLDAQPRLPTALGRLLPAFVQGWRFVRAGGENLWRFAKSDFHFFAGMNYLIRAFYSSIVEERPVPIAYRDLIRISVMLETIWKQLDLARQARTELAGRAQLPEGGAR